MSTGVTAPDLSMRRLVSVAWPLVLHGLVTILVSANDVVLLGGAGALVIASATVASSMLTVLVAGLSAFAVGAQIEGSRARGAGDPRGAVVAASATLRVVAMVGVPLLAGVALAAPLLTREIGGSAADADLAATYLRITLCGVPLAVLAGVLRAYATALARTRVVLVASVAAAGTDITVALALEPAVGWRGVAIGTICGYAASAAAFLVWRSRLDRAERPRLPLRPTGAERRLVDLGWPEALLATFSTASGVVVAFVVSGSTSAVLASVRLLDVQIAVAWVVMSGIGTALLTLLGEARGAGRDDLFRGAISNAARLLVLVAGCLFVLGAPAAQPIVRLVAGPDAGAAVGWLGVLAWTQVGWLVGCVLSVTVCRALRDTRASLVASLVGEYAVFLPLGLILCRVLSLDVLGVVLAHHAFWIAFVAVAASRARSAWNRDQVLVEVV